MEGLLREEAETGGDICGLVVDLAVEVANYIVLASFNAAKQIGLDSITLLGHHLLMSADSACTAAHRGVQQLLDAGVTSLDSSSTIDLSAASDEHPLGTSPLDCCFACTACSVHSWGTPNSLRVALLPISSHHMYSVLLSAL
jgi:hypothetical protein